MVAKWSLRLFSCLCAFIHLSSASVINCTCSYGGDKTTCAIAEESWISDASGCQYSWLVEGVVVANQFQNNSKVVKSYNINELVAFNHLNKTAFSRHCPSEKQKYTADCLISNTENPLGPKKQEGGSNPWPVIAVVGIVLLLVGGILVFVYCRSRPRDGTPRIPWLNQFKNIWSRVKTAEDDPEAAVNETL